MIRQRGHRIRLVNIERQPAAQPDVDRYRGLIVLGGPMNVEDQAQRPHLRTGLRAIERALAQDKPVLGICLGAQFLTHVPGAPIRRLPPPERPAGTTCIPPPRVGTSAGREQPPHAPTTNR